MKMYKVELYLTDTTGEYGQGKDAKKLVKEMLESELGDFSARVGKIEQTEIGEWYDGHRFNKNETHIAEFKAAFGV